MTGFLLTIYKIGAKIFTGTGISQNRVIRKILHKMNSQLKSEFVNIEGNRLFLDVEDALFLSVNGLHEKTETELIKKEIKKGDFVIDIGANIGYYTLLFAKLVGSSGHVLAFEPESKKL